MSQNSVSFWPLPRTSETLSRRSDALHKPSTPNRTPRPSQRSDHPLQQTQCHTSRYIHWICSQNIVICPIHLGPKWHPSRQIARFFIHRLYVKIKTAIFTISHGQCLHDFDRQRWSECLNVEIIRINNSMTLNSSGSGSGKRREMLTQISSKTKVNFFCVLWKLIMFSINWICLYLCNFKRFAIIKVP